MTALRRILVAAVGLACFGPAPASAASDSEPATTPPLEASLSRSAPERNEYNDVSVQIVAKTSSQIGAPRGGRLETFPLLDGDRFSAGDVLAKFHCEQQDAQLARARSELQKRRGILQTNQKLRQLGTWGQNEFQVALAEVNTAVADVALAQATVEACVVKAPFTGRVAAVAARNYQFVVPGAPLLEILDDRSLELELVVPSLWLSWLAAGAPFRIRVAETGLDYEAEITRTSGRVEAVSRIIKVYGTIKGGHDRLLPGMSGTAIFAQR